MTHAGCSTVLAVLYLYSYNLNLIILYIFPFFRHLVLVSRRVPALLSSDPSLGGGGPAESSDQRGSELRVAACHSSHVHQQVD